MSPFTKRVIFLAALIVTSFAFTTLLFYNGRSKQQVNPVNSTNNSIKVIKAAGPQTTTLKLYYLDLNLNPTSGQINISDTGLTTASLPSYTPDLKPDPQHNLIQYHIKVADGTTLIQQGYGAVVKSLSTLNDQRVFIRVLTLYRPGALISLEFPDTQTSWKTVIK
ncbi:hypothetical protein M1523_02010 [Patescibacteria group bacterium]|nr:hypothetical protein [Patescibacteria group bacterium]MCL5091986.1 hypothetical protein [Patescibacteria group bacterium]